jgi:diguanylate cyclase (GGDEF)-like protein/PAS domain S-box-containing protein
MAPTGKDVLFEAIAAAIPDGVIIIDERGIMRTFNPGAERLFGYLPSEAIGQNVSILMPSPHAAAHDGYLARYLATGTKHIIGVGREVMGRHKDGHLFPAYLSVGEAHYDQRRLFVGILHDLTEFKRTKEEANQAQTLRHLNAALEVEMAKRTQAEKALFREKERFEVTLASIGEGVIATDGLGKIVFVNPMAEQLTGWPIEEAVGQSLPAVLNIAAEAPGHSITEYLRRSLCGIKSTSPANTQLIRRDGTKRFIEDAFSPIKNANAETIGSVITFRDITEKHVAARRVAQMTWQLAHQSTHDSLTGLINRAEFERRLKRVIDTCAPHATHALLYIDLDQFKIVNDTCGHAAGDELLQQVGVLMQGHIRKRDTLARLGGDEFGALLEHCTVDQATHIAEQLRHAVREHEFLWRDQGFHVGVSIGLVPVTGLSGTHEEIMRAADSACYVAKEQGRDGVHVFRTDDRELAQRSSQMGWVSRIQDALAHNRLRLELQPVVSLAAPGRKVDHAEVLLRMVGRDGGIILPDAFIPAAERFGQMLAIDEWVIERVVDTIRDAPPAHCPGTIGVNISAQSLCDKRFLPFVLKVLGKSNAHHAASKLCFEITETAAVTNYRCAQEFIAALRVLGCRFALDDFGSGLSSFSHLKNLHVDFVKIDGRYIAGVLGDAVDRAVVNAIQKICHAMNIKTIAEFVENDETVVQLRKIGVEYAQGWYFGRPRSIDALSNEDLCAIPMSAMPIQP